MILGFGNHFEAEVALLLDDLLHTIAAQGVVIGADVTLCINNSFRAAASVPPEKLNIRTFDESEACSPAPRIPLTPNPE